jgi:signal transduction histidine kinase
VFLDPLRWKQAQPRLNALPRLSYRLGKLETYLEETVQALGDLFKLDWVVITLQQQGQERIQASSSPIARMKQDAKLAGVLTDAVMATGSTLVVEGINDLAGYAQQDFAAHLGIPLINPMGEVMGAVCLFQRQPRRFPQDEVQVIEAIAEEVATTIDNYLLYQQQFQLNQYLRTEVTECLYNLQITQQEFAQIYQQLELRAQQQAQQQVDEAEQMNQQLHQEVQQCEQTKQELIGLAEVGKLAAMIVHEIRNPLTTVIMGLSALSPLELPERIQPQLTLALEEAERLKRLLASILQYAKPPIPQLQILNLNELTEELLHSVPISTETRQIQLVSTLSSAWILGDRDQLKQIIVNLTQNAVEATQPGDIITWYITADVGLAQVCLSVHNNGDPVMPEVLAKLGTPFFTTKAAGNGLGLAIVKRIVEAHGGQLTIESTLSEGTKVNLQFPLVQLPDSK